MVSTRSLYSDIQILARVRLMSTQNARVLMPNLNVANKSHSKSQGFDAKSKPYLRFVAPLHDGIDQLFDLKTVKDFSRILLELETFEHIEVISYSV